MYFDHIFFNPGFFSGFNVVSAYCPDGRVKRQRRGKEGRCD